MMKYNLSFLLILFLFFTFSCKTVKVIEDNRKGLSLESIYDSVRLASPNYDRLEVKFNLDYENGDQVLSLKGNLKVVKDSFIWISLTPGLGFEVRMKCNKDSVFILNMIEKTYTTGDFKYIKNTWKIDADYNILQSILTGSFFLYPTAENEKKEFTSTFSIRKDSAELEVYRKNLNNVENLLKIQKNNYKTSEYLINDIDQMRTLSIKYTFEILPEGYEFPKKIAIKSNNSGKFLNLNISISKVTINGNPKFPFTVPASYKVIAH
jgi:hypothetical protein